MPIERFQPIDQSLDRTLGWLVALFGDLAKCVAQDEAAHPAVVLFDDLQLLKDEGATLVEARFPLVVRLLKLELQFPTCAPHDAPEQFWSVIEDPSVKARVEQVIADPRQFDVALTELAYWGWLKQLGHNGVRVEEEGLADLVIDPGDEREVRADIKNISATTHPNL